MLAIDDAFGGRADMFFLRCAFWLTVVYASMSWPNDTFRLPDLAGRALSMSHIETQGFSSKAVAGITDLCSHHREVCMAEAARLTSLVAAEGGAADAAAGTPKVQEARAVPRAPVSHPRKPGRDAKLHAAP